VALIAPIEGVALRLRCVETNSKIIELRTDEILTRYLPPIKADLIEQKDWIASQRNNPKDYYFAVEKKYQSSNEVEGFIGLYDFTEDNKSAEWGRWVLSKSSLASVESAYLIYKFAFDKLGLHKIKCRTVVNNYSVIALHDRCGLKRSDVLEGEFYIDKNLYDAVEHTLTIEEWPAVKQQLEIWVYRFSSLLMR
jgi:RimJ/RimL family protein N-acetyltransferase